MVFGMAGRILASLLPAGDQPRQNLSRSLARRNRSLRGARLHDRGSRARGAGVLIAAVAPAAILPVPGLWRPTLFDDGAQTVSESLSGQHGAGSPDASGNGVGGRRRLRHAAQSAPAAGIRK